MKEDKLIPELERRLHRVKITLTKTEIKCPNAKFCNEAENCYRCNRFYNKCAIYIRATIKR
jgi:hypothetical protein